MVVGCGRSHRTTTAPRLLNGRASARPPMGCRRWLGTDRLGSAQCVARRVFRRLQEGDAATVEDVQAVTVLAALSGTRDDEAHLAVPNAQAANLVFVDLVKQNAERKGATRAQVALAWVIAQKPWTVPIPAPRSCTA